MPVSIEKKIGEFNKKVITGNVYDQWTFRPITDDRYLFIDKETGKSGKLAMFGSLRGLDGLVLIPLYKGQSSLTDEQLNVTFSTKGFEKCREEFFFHQNDKPIYRKLLDESEFVLLYGIYVTDPVNERVVPVRYKNKLHEYIIKRCPVCFSTQRKITTAYAMVKQNDMESILRKGSIPIFAESFTEKPGITGLQWDEFIKVEKEIPGYPKIIDALNDWFTSDLLKSCFTEYSAMESFLTLKEYTVYDNKKNKVKLDDRMHIRDVLDYRVVPERICETQNIIRINTKWDNTLSVYEILLKQIRLAVRAILSEKIASFFPSDPAAEKWLNDIYDCDRYKKNGYSPASQLISLLSGNLICDIITPLDMLFIKNNYTVEEISGAVRTGRSNRTIF